MSANPKPSRIVNEELLKEVREMPCCACGASPPSDAAHIRSRGAGGHDEWTNLIPLCRSCHALQHSQGFISMMGRHKNLAKALRERGWVVVGFCSGWKLVQTTHSAQS